MTFFVTYLAKTGYFLSFDREKLIFITFGPPLKNTFDYLWNNPLLAIPWKKSFRHPWSGLAKEK